MFFPTLPKEVSATVSKTAVLLLLLIPHCISAQSTATLQGRVRDSTGAIIPKVSVTARSQGTGDVRSALSDQDGAYLVAALPAGIYRVEVKAQGFRTQVIEAITIGVGRIVVQDFQLEVGDLSQTVLVQPNSLGLDNGSISLGQVTDQRTVQTIPLNGRYFLDIALLAAGSVTPSSNGFSTTPSRGVGALAINTAGNREETVNFLVNGITLNNQAFNSISFQPSISTVQEFKIDNSTLSAESGQTSGAAVNIATRSGTNKFHGEIFEFLRNDALDARNFFNFTSSKPPPFKRNQFGGNLGGPVLKERTFFFVTYEGLHQRQSLDLNSVVLSDLQRAAVTDRVISKLVPLIPRANFVDSSGTSRFVGSVNAPVNNDQWTIDINHSLSEADRLHGYYSFVRTTVNEPNRNGSTIPGFGHLTKLRRQIFTLNETHTFGPSQVNELRMGFNRIFGTLTPNNQLDPSNLGISDGVAEPIGLPQINVAGGAFNFGGPAGLPAGRGDTTLVFSDTVNRLQSNHFLKFGGEYRQFLNNNFARDTGFFNFPTVDAFINGVANAFSITLGNRTSSIVQRAVNAFVQDNFNWKPNLMVGLGLRYEWNLTPSERYHRFIVFDPESASLLRVGTDLDLIYHQNNKNFEPRVGLSWDPLKDGKTAVRLGYALSVDQPMTSAVAATATNPPLGTPLIFAGQIKLDEAIQLARAAGLAPQTIDHQYDNSYLQSWNLNLQREVKPNLTLSIGYFGSKGTHLLLRRNINQPIDGTRPFPALSEMSPILPGEPLGNITKVESSGNSSYNALWITANQRLSHGIEFNFAYTWSKSLDYNSLSSEGVVVQNSYDLRNDWGPSGFDTRHRFVATAVYELPFKGNQLTEGWEIAIIVQSQSGNPLNIVTATSTVNGLPNTVRPDVTGPITLIRDVDRWFDTSVFVAVPSFGNLGRNVVVGPRFNNTNLSVIKDLKFGEGLRAQLRAEFFDLFNHANFGNPGNLVESPTFGRVTNTRFPTGELGSSRQIQFALKVTF